MDGAQILTCNRDCDLDLEQKRLWEEVILHLKSECRELIRWKEGSLLWSSVSGIRDSEAQMSCERREPGALKELMAEA